MYNCLNKHLGWKHKEAYFIKDEQEDYENTETK